MDEPGTAEGRVAPEGSPEATDAELMRWAFDQAPTALVIYDAHGRLLRINERMLSLGSGLSEADIRGRRLTDFIQGPAFTESERLIRKAAATGEPEYFESYSRLPAEDRPHSWAITFTPLKDSTDRVRAVSVAVRDFTEQDLTRHRLALLNEAGTVIGSTLDVTRTAQELADVTVPAFADFTGVDLLEGVFHGEEPSAGPVTGEIRLRRTAHRAAEAGYSEVVVGVGESGTYPEFTPPARCLLSGEAALYRSTDPDVVRWLDQEPARAQWARQNGMHSLIVVPVQARGTTLGVAVLIRHATTPAPFGEDDLLIAREIVNRAAICLDNARRYTRERTTALTLQRSLLPQHAPRQPAVEVATRYLPAGAQAGVGGDWFDVIPLSGTRVALVVGDVFGHGLHASATMGRLRTAVRTLADVDLPPEELLAHLDGLVSSLNAESDAAPPGDGTGEIGASCLYAIYDPVSRRCALARAGHLPPAVLTPGGTVDLIDLPAGPPLGLGGLAFESTEVELPEGSLLALYTDGLVVSRDRDIDEGVAALRRTLERPAASLGARCDAVLQALVADHPADDVALLLARTRALGADQVVTWDIPADPAYVAEARKQASRQLGAWGLDDAAFVTELVVSELVTNAIRYGSPPVRLRLIKDRTLICEVSDAASTAPHLRRARIFDEGGRGLMLVAQFTDRWGTRHTPTGKTIWTEQHLP
ncbi:SpoIIE family protein phosphatase [Kitasatospora atroaurantiaca]|uniref:PAS domain S-box-containing protein n=1 Tax=Kitasatospora atroaurantiaca TaxID=285545 RepID=A0A561EI89_9ACTN|nr:SpoIIE family protein phosphatase [Kitasatospora atroaurantiaca]TWE15330.1 PAS domain S-box-containing protein [Kitasatospora atroaurantiaca]